METTYDVKAYKILTYKGTRKTTTPCVGRSRTSAGMNPSAPSHSLRASAPN